MSDEEYKFKKTIKNTKLYDAPIREIYDKSISYMYNTEKDMVYEYKLYRHMVNTIRHDYTNYETNLKKYIHDLNRNNKDDYYYIRYKNYILDKISDKYPLLKNECNNQKQYITLVHRRND